MKDQYPRMKFDKVRGSEDDKSYKVKVTDQRGKVRILEIKKNPRKSALDNWTESSRMKVENAARPRLSKEKIDRYKKKSDRSDNHTAVLELVKLSKGSLDDRKKSS